MNAKFKPTELKEIESLARMAIEDERDNVDPDFIRIELLRRIAKRAEGLQGSIEAEREKPVAVMDQAHGMKLAKKLKAELTAPYRHRIEDVFEHFNMCFESDTLERGAELYDMLRNDGDFYKKTQRIRKQLALRVSIGYLPRYSFLPIREFRDIIYRTHPSPPAIATVAAKLLVDYWLDEIELGNIIY